MRKKKENQERTALMYGAPTPMLWPVFCFFSY